MKKILILSNSDAGLYEFRKEIVSALIAEGYEVHISVPDTGHIKTLEELGGIMHVTMLDRRGMNPARDIKLYKAYKRLIHDIKPVLVLTYTIKPNVYGGVACKMCKVPFFANVTGLGSTLQGEGLLKKFVVTLYKTGLKKASCVFFQNKFNMEFMKAEGCIAKSANARLLPGSGVNLEEHAMCRYPMDDGCIHFLNVGRMMDDKGSSELLKVAEQISEKYPNIVFDILGTYEDETREKYEPWVKRLEQKGIVVHHGFRTDVDTFYDKCHAVVHPSYHEGMSNVVLEAAAVGRPVITSDIPGCNEIYEDGISGIAFEPRNSEALYAALEQFIRMPLTEKENMGFAARKYVEEHFDRRLVIDAYFEEISKLNLNRT